MMVFGSLFGQYEVYDVRQMLVDSSRSDILVGHNAAAVITLPPRPLSASMCVCVFASVCARIIEYGPWIACVQRVCVIECHCRLRIHTKTANAETTIKSKRNFSPTETTTTTAAATAKERTKWDRNGSVELLYAYIWSAVMVCVCATVCGYICVECVFAIALQLLLPMFSLLA